MLTHWLLRNRACSARTLLRKVRTARLVFRSAHKLTNNDAKDTASAHILTAGMLSRLLSASTASLVLPMLASPYATSTTTLPHLAHTRPQSRASAGQGRAQLAAQRST